MMTNAYIARLRLGVALAGVLTLAACGDGGGSSVASTPPPPASYTKLADLTGNQTFQSGGVHWTAGPVVGGTTISNRAADAFGSGPTYAYNAASDSFTVTAGSTTATFTQVDFVPAQSTATARVFIKNVAGGQQQLRLTAPTVNGVILSYTQFARFLDGQGPSANTWSSVGGVPTIASDMPKTGSATYTASVAANVLAAPVTATAPFTVYTTTAASTAAFSANFAAGTVATSVQLIATPPSSSVTTDFGTFNGTGTITAGGPGFSGSFTGTTGAGFSGAFFGPQAAEMGYTFNFVSGSIEAFGGVAGTKN